MYTPPDRLLDAEFWRTATFAEVEAELARGIDPNIDGSGELAPSTMTPLHLAAGHARPPLIEVLLDCGANIEAQENFLGRTPIHMAASFNEVEVVALLLDRGANIAARDKYGDTILHAAVSEDQRAIVELLLGLGMSIEATNKWGYTPLHKTAWNRSAETAVLLIARGADRNAQGCRGLHSIQDTAGRCMDAFARDGKRRLHS